MRMGGWWHSFLAMDDLYTVWWKYMRMGRWWHSFLAMDEEEKLMPPFHSQTHRKKFYDLCAREGERGLERIKELKRMS